MKRGFSVRGGCYHCIPLMSAQRKKLAERRFAHESEAEFARFLDFYGIQWRFEAVCFALNRDSRGRVTESFTPDFFLPQLELFVELTTMKQSLVTRKNRKIRLMRELYPDVRIKILYGRDYRKLLFKFGVAP